MALLVQLKHEFEGSGDWEIEFYRTGDFNKREVKCYPQIKIATLSQFLSTMRLEWKAIDMNDEEYTKFTDWQLIRGELRSPSREYAIQLSQDARKKLAQQLNQDIQSSEWLSGHSDGNYEHLICLKDQVRYDFKMWTS